MSNTYAQNFQLGISTKVLTTSSNLGGDEWDFMSDKWELLLNKTDVTCKFSGITKKTANIKLDLKVQVVGSTNTSLKILTYDNTSAPGGIAQVKFKYDFAEVVGTSKKIIFEVVGYVDGTNVGFSRRTVTLK